MGAEIAGRLAADYPARAVVLADPALRNFAEMFKTGDDSLPSWMQPILETIQALRQEHPPGRRQITCLLSKSRHSLRTAGISSCSTSSTGLSRSCGASCIQSWYHCPQLSNGRQFG
ncbi:MAG: hypothetical protein KJ064_21675 [Anaerolineae bacterium]|nr:hypothetical protein [Anaerolineae bacterium]